jgi:histidinol-phosphate aminotransferase
MTQPIREEFRDDLRSRGYSRRHVMRAAAMLGSAAALSSLRPEGAFAADAPAQPQVRIGTNECWTGPMAGGIAAASAVLSQCNRYSPHGDRATLLKAISQVENVPEDHISPWPGAYTAVARSVLAFCSPTKGLVTCDPAYETPGRAAEWLGAPVKAVPLRTTDYSHDVRAMLAADPNAGMYYICNPNNPTGTMTSTADIEWLVNNKPAGAMVVIDEAYIHWSKDYPSNSLSRLAAAGKDVLVMRTFSKIFAMAGMRLGYFMARPDLIKKMELYDDGELSTQLPIPAVACATASIADQVSIASRRKTLMENRAVTIDFLNKRKMKLIMPTDANMLMVDWKSKTAKEMQAAFRTQGVQIAGARWPTWPTVSRITIGSKEDMHGFFAALDKVVSA